jgi:O-antigen/teichoic acid export membrane protein
MGQGTEFLAFVIFARRLGTADFGRLAVAFIICRYAGLIADWGASVRGPRDVAANRAPAQVRALVRRRELATAALVVVYLIVVTAWGRTELGPLAITIAGRGLARDWLALGKERGWRAGAPSVIQGCVVLAAAPLVNDIGTAAWAIAVGYGVALAVSVRVNPAPKGRALGHVPVDAWILVAVLADQVAASTDTVLLAALRSAREAGIYAAVYRIPNAWMTVIGLAVIGFVPATARLVSEQPHRVIELRHRAIRVGAAVAGAVLLTIPGLWFAVPVLFGDAFRSGRGPLAILLVATAVSALGAPLHPLYLAIGRDRTQAAITAGVATLNLISNLIVIPWAGGTGAAATTLVAQTMLLVLFWRGITAAGERAGGRA